MARLDTKCNPARLGSRAAGNCHCGSEPTPTPLVICLVPGAASPAQKNSRGGGLKPPPPPEENHLSNWRADYRRRAARVGTDHTGLVGEESALPGGAGVHGHGCNRVLVGVASRIRCFGRVREFVAALDARSQDRVNQVRSRRRGRGCRLQIGQRDRVAGPEGGGVSDASRVTRPQRANRRRFVRCHLRTQQVGEGNRRDDQNDRHDDQKLDKRKTLLPVPHTLSFDFYTSTRNTRLIEATAVPSRRGAYTLSAQSPEGPWNKQLAAASERHLPGHPRLGRHRTKPRVRKNLISGWRES